MDYLIAMFLGFGFYIVGFWVGRDSRKGQGPWFNPATKEAKEHKEKVGITSIVDERNFL